MAITANPFANGYLHGKLVPAYNEHFFLCLGPSTSGFSVQLEHSCSAVLKRAHTPLDLGRRSVLFAAVVCRFKYLYSTASPIVKIRSYNVDDNADDSLSETFGSLQVLHRDSFTLFNHDFPQALHQDSSASKLDKLGISVNPSLYSSVLQRCGHLQSLIEGKLVHDHIIRHGYEHNPFVSNCLGYMYGHCGALTEACVVFSGMHRPDVFSWNFLIRAYSLHGQVREALNLLIRQQVSGVSPDKYSFISILSVCDDVLEGMLLHVWILDVRLEKDLLVGNVLVRFYGKCGSIADAEKTFTSMIRKDLVSWNTMISVYAQHEETDMVFCFFNMIKDEDIIPDTVTFVTLLSVIANRTAFVEGQNVHMLILHSDFVYDVSIGNALINMYGKCNLLADAWYIFREMPRKDMISWNAILTAYACSPDGKQALQLYDFLQSEGLVPNKVSFVAVLNACACEGSLSSGKRVHTYIINRGMLSDIVVSTAVVHMYSKCRSLADAEIVFGNLTERSLPIWNSMLAAYSNCQYGSFSLSLFHRMLCESVLPDQATHVSVISSCANQVKLFDCKCIHAAVHSSNASEDVRIGTCLIHMYGKRGLYDEAYRLFCKLPVVNLVTWNTIITVYAQHEMSSRIEKLYKQVYIQALIPDNVTFLSTLSACVNPEHLVMGKHIHTCILWNACKSDVSIASALIYMYGKCRALIDAQEIFETMESRTLSCWNALLGAYSESGSAVATLELFYRMQREGVMVDKVTYISILGASTLEIPEVDVLRLHTYLTGSNIGADVALSSAFINMYGKFGKLTDALRMFVSGPKHEIDTWNALITVYSQSGCGHESFEIYFKLQKEGLVPNSITYVSLLSGCSHAGLVDEGFYFFHSFITGPATPKAEHYNCMIDLFGRAGRLEEAEFMVNKMPFDSSMTSLLILLASCKYQADVRRAERVTYIASMVDPNDSTPYVMLRNIYSILDA
ncbi:hypothetical protein KP509_19G069600 [Ceratopteris richardii]|uniref:Pentatricopeptide repeat-containing protein n=2 Tax=Ceratopteris richardii TaxID=49495 RepID=A0A8T2SPX1_CERRI|nr:hypothetical protein KP509_19G069600 [Ceratopteris richardii]KAH7352912.1 hypothetical protein KP509_19G069600 [Ceratopteris richardii]KAH7352914.1 hypothetical protein KP509_19G069600 [Ceratopteris richardii]